MQFPKRYICPLCLREVATAGVCCVNSGRDISTADYKTQAQTEFYEIVPDGEMFGITLRGEMRISGLELESAQKIITALNRSCGVEELEK